VLTYSEKNWTTSCRVEPSDGFLTLDLPSARNSASHLNLVPSRCSRKVADLPNRMHASLYPPEIVTRKGNLAALLLETQQGDSEPESVSTGNDDCIRVRVRLLSKPVRRDERGPRMNIPPEDSATASSYPPFTSWIAKYPLPVHPPHIPIICQWYVSRHGVHPDKRLPKDTDVTVRNAGWDKCFNGYIHLNIGSKVFASSGIPSLMCCINLDNWGVLGTTPGFWTLCSSSLTAVPIILFEDNLRALERLKMTLDSTDFYKLELHKQILRLIFLDWKFE
jgi:hypothetical protein